MEQAEHMARFSSVPITEEQKHLYAVLRETTRNSEKRPDSPPETEPPRKLTDQRLMAEVIRLTGGAHLADFMQAYPNIFNAEGIMPPVSPVTEP